MDGTFKLILILLLLPCFMAMVEEKLEGERLLEMGKW